MNDDYPDLTVSQVDTLEALAATGLQPKTRAVGDALVELGIFDVRFRDVVSFRNEDTVRHVAKPVYSLTERGVELARVVDILRSRAHSKSMKLSRSYARGKR